MWHGDIGTNEIKGGEAIERLGYSSGRNLKPNVTGSAFCLIEGILMKLR